MAELTKCWLYAGVTDRNGYPQISRKGQTDMVHRLMYEQEVGKIPKGYHIDHLCGVRCCINPEHLEAVTPKDNVLRSKGIAAKYATRTECSRGHPFNKENTGVYSYASSGATFRKCLVCNRKQMNDRNAAKRVANKEGVLI